MEQLDKLMCNTLVNELDSFLIYCLGSKTVNELKKNDFCYSFVQVFTLLSITQKIIEVSICDLNEKILSTVEVGFKNARSYSTKKKL